MNEEKNNSSKLESDKGESQKDNANTSANRSENSKDAGRTGQISCSKESRRRTRRKAERYENLETRKEIRRAEIIREADALRSSAANV